MKHLRRFSALLNWFLKSPCSAAYTGAHGGATMEEKIAGRWFITPHAVRQYIHRVRPGLLYPYALAELIRLSECARYIKQLNHLELWRGPKPLRLRLYIGRQRNGAPQLVTVLKGPEKAS